MDGKSKAGREERDLGEGEDNPKSKAKTTGKQAPTNTGKLLGKGVGAEHGSQGSSATSWGRGGEALAASCSTRLCSTGDTRRWDAAEHKDSTHSSRAQPGWAARGQHPVGRWWVLPSPTPGWVLSGGTRRGHGTQCKPAAPAAQAKPWSRCPEAWDRVARAPCGLEGSAPSGNPFWLTVATRRGFLPAAG